MHQETCGNFQDFLQEILVCIGGSSITSRGVYSKQKIKKTYKSLRPTDSWPKPTDLMDPDQTNAPRALDWSRSIRIWIKRPEIEESGSGLGQPDPNAYIKGCYTRSPSFCVTFSLSSLLLSAVLSTNPNPKFLNLAQKRFVHGLIRSCHCSKHESSQRKQFQPSKRCESLNFYALGSNCSDLSRFWLNLL